MADRIKEQRDALLLHVDDCLARVLVAVLLDGGSTDNRATLESVLKKLPEKKEELLSQVARGAGSAVNLHLRWLAEAFLEIKATLRSVDVERIATFRRAGEKTGEIFEDKIEECRQLIEKSTSGVFACVREIFKENREYDKHSVEVLNLAEEIKSKAEIIRRRLDILVKPYLQFLTRKGLVLSLFVLFVLLVPIAYVYRAYRETGSVDTAIVTQKVQHDTEELRATIQNREVPVLDRVAVTVKKVSEITSTIPNLLLLCTLALGLVRRFLLREKWQHPKLTSFEGELQQLAKSLRAEIKGS
jgi:hypothetical protein